MAQRYYNIEKVAEVLGIAPAEVNRLREKNELRAYRDGADWKFNVDEVEEYLARKIKGHGQSSDGLSLAEDDSADVLFNDQELGNSDPGSSGTVIGPTLGVSPESDIQLTDSEIKLASSGLHLSDEAVQPPGGVSPLSGIARADDLELTLDADLTLEDSQISLAPPATAGFGTGDSSLELVDAGSMDDDDLVLGGSGSGSDITIGGDSGISLVDPTDSGLSLEEPLQVSGADESVELGEDDMLTIAQGGSSVIGQEGSGSLASESPTQLKADSDFLLTPMEEVSGEESESSSQVIALDADSEVIDDSSATMVASMSGVGAAAASGIGRAASRPVMPPMLDDSGPGIDLDTATAGAAAGAAAAMGQRPAYAEAPAAMGQAMGHGVLVPPETPYPTWVMAMLISGTVLLGIGGMMSFDLLRNMWSWNGPYSLNSTIMDALLGLFGK